MRTFGEKMDPILVNMVDGTNKGMIKDLGITLNIKGIIVSGILISYKEYYVELENMCKDRLDFILKELKQFIEKKDKEENYSLPQLIHLKNAKYFLDSSKSLPEKMFLWRGKLSEVDGFSFGNIKEMPRLGIPPKFVK